MFWPPLPYHVYPMNWKQILFPGPMRRAFKRMRRINVGLQGQWGTLLLLVGRPRAVAERLGRERFGARVVLNKQEILSLIAGDRFIRYAAKAGGAGKLEREYEAWLSLKSYGFDEILPRTLTLHRDGRGTFLEVERLWSIRRNEQLAVSLPIVRTLLAHAKPVRHDRLPATVEAGLQLARKVAGGSLPATFASEQDIRQAFNASLLTGMSHEDLHFRNVMRDGEGRPVMVDLKSCSADRILALDVLAFACKYLEAQERRNTIDMAYVALRRKWQIPPLYDVLCQVDLPRAAWAPIYVLHAIGRLARKLQPGAEPNPIFARLLARVISRDWRLPP